MGENIVAYSDKLYINGKIVTEEDMQFVWESIAMRIVRKVDCRFL